MFTYPTPHTSNGIRPLQFIRMIEWFELKKGILANEAKIVDDFAACWNIQELSGGLANGMIDSSQVVNHTGMVMTPLSSQSMKRRFFKMNRSNFNLFNLSP